MAPFRYDPFVNPYAQSIGDLIQRSGEIAANRDIQVANARARAQQSIAEATARQQEIAGQTNAHLITSLADTASRIPTQIATLQESKRREQMTQIALKDAQRRQAGQQAMSSLLQGSGPMRPGEVGPEQDSYLDANGLFDVQKITGALGQMGMGDQAADLVKGAESINDSILKHQKLEQETAQQHAVLLGDLANGALKLTKSGTPLEQAMDFVVQPAIATKRIDPKEYAQVKQQILAMEPAQQEQALTTLMDQAAQLGGTKNISEGAQEVDRYGRVIASNPKSEKPQLPTQASLAADLSSHDEAVRNRAKTALEALKPAPAPTRRTDTEQALDAYAQSIGKTKAEELTYAERQQFEKDKAQASKDAAFDQFKRNRDYEVAHPMPEKPLKPKSQDELEQEYRTVLARGLSSRSGGLGLEDAKVQQANHLIALLDQSYDQKKGEYNITKVQQTELALGLARLLSPNGQVGVQLEQEINQATALGDINKVLTYITGTPFKGSTQDVIKMFRDSILRQGKVAEQNREGEMSYLRGLAPTTLDEARRKQLEATTLNPLRESTSGKAEPKSGKVGKYTYTVE